LVVAFAVVALGAAWPGSLLTAQEPKPAADAKPVDLSALRDAVATASKRGENVDEIRTALDAFEKAMPKAQAGRVPPELQALRNAVDAAARKGENVDAIAKELLAVEMLVAGKSLAKPKPEPQPNPAPGFPNPGPFGGPLPLPLPNPNVPFPVMPNLGLGAGGGIDLDTFNKAVELRKKAVEMLLQNPGNADLQKEMQKLHAEADELMRKALRGTDFERIAPGLPVGPGLARVPERARLGIRMDHVSALAAEQLGLDPNTGIAVAFVSPGSAAEKAGLKVHDIILEFAGKPVTDDANDFIRRVNEAKAGVKFDIVVLRKGKKVDVKGVELADPQR
jgi:hypothetical protein